MPSRVRALSRGRAQRWHLPQQLEGGDDLLGALATGLTGQQGDSVPHTPADRSEPPHCPERLIQFTDVASALAEEAVIPAQQRCAGGAHDVEVDELAFVIFVHALLRVSGTTWR